MYQPNLEQYKNQAKDLLHAHARAEPAAVRRIARHHPRLHEQPLDSIRLASFQLSDAQLVIAREHGFESWPKLARHIETLRLSREVAPLDDPAAAFIEAACSPRHGHRSGTLEEAEMILARYPHVAASSIYTSAILADEANVRAHLARPSSAIAKGGPRRWDALTHLCFSRYLRLDRTRSDAFVGAAGALLDARASLERIAIDSDVRFGKPCIRGHRITVQEILEWLSSGASQQQILVDYPQIEPDDFVAVYAYAAEMASGNKVSKG